MATLRTFVKVYDNLLDHPAWVELDPVHVGVWVLMLGYCRRQRTDGHFPVKAATRTGATESDLSGLLEGGRFHAPGHDCEACPQPAEGHLYLHAYLDHQNSAAQLEALSEVRKTAGQKGGQAKAKHLATKVVASGLAEEEREEEKDSPAAGAAVSDSFAAFWTEYPHKVGKDAAARAYSKAVKRTDATTILEGLRNAVQAWRREGWVDKGRAYGKHYVPHASTWLNGGRWADEVPLPDMPATQPQRPTRTLNLCTGDDCPGSRHEWTDGRNAFVCMGA